MSPLKDVLKALSIGFKPTTRTHRPDGGYRAGEKEAQGADSKGSAFAATSPSAKKVGHISPDSATSTCTVTVPSVAAFNTNERPGPIIPNPKSASSGASAKFAHVAAFTGAKRTPISGSHRKGGSAAASDVHKDRPAMATADSSSSRAKNESAIASATTGDASRKAKNKPKASVNNRGERGATSTSSQGRLHSYGPNRESGAASPISIKGSMGQKGAKDDLGPPPAAGKKRSPAAGKINMASLPDIPPVHTRSASGATPTSGKSTAVGPEDDRSNSAKVAYSEWTSEEVSKTESETPHPMLQRRRGEAYVPPGWFKPRESHSSEEEVESGVASFGEGSGSKGAAVSSTMSPRTLRVLHTRRSFLQRVSGGENELSARRRCALCTTCCVLGACVASLVAYFLLRPNDDTSWDHECRTQFCAQAHKLLSPARGAPNPCDDFYGHVCYEFERHGVNFLEALRLRRKSDYHEHMLANADAASTGDANRRLAFAHQVCAQFSHRQNPSLRTMGLQMRQSLMETQEMKDFLEARTPHNETVRVLTRAAVRIGIGTLFTVAESTAASDRRLRIIARLPPDYAFGISERDKLLTHVDSLLRYLWRNKATDLVLRGIVGLATTLSKMSFENDVIDDVENLEEFVPPPGHFKLGRMITDSVPADLHLHHNVSAVVVNSRIITRAYGILAAEDRDTSNLYLLVLFFDEYLKQVVGSQQTFQESLSCTLLGSKLFPSQYGTSEAALFYDQIAARELRDVFENAKVTAAAHLDINAQSVDVNLNILEEGSFRTERDAFNGTTLYNSHALNIVEGLKVTMTGMLRRVAEGKYGGEARSLVEGQFRGIFDYDARVSSLLVATQNLQPPFYCHNRSVTLLSASADQNNGTAVAAVPVSCEGGKLRPFLNFGLAATAMVEAILSFIISNKQAKDIEERARCYMEQLELDSGTTVETTSIVRSAVGLSLSLAMLKSSNMALWRDLQLTKENRTALQLFFHRHCLRHCAPSSKANATAGFLTGEHKCRLALINMEEFFKAYNCRRNAGMVPRKSCPI